MGALFSRLNVVDKDKALRGFPTTYKLIFILQPHFNRLLAFLIFHIFCTHTKSIYQIGNIN